MSKNVYFALTYIPYIIKDDKKNIYKKLEIIYLKAMDEKSKHIIEPKYPKKLDYPGKIFNGIKVLAIRAKK